MFQILIIDDSKAVHAFLKNLLAKSEGIQTASVFNGSAGLDDLKKGKKYDLIFLDWEMPVLNGPETLESLRGSGVQTPIIMMTTKNNPSDIQKMLELGASEYMMKPYTVDILFEKIEFVTGKAFKYVA